MPNNKRNDRAPRITRRARINNNRSPGKSLRVAFNGATIKNRPDPPTIVQRPWNSVTLALIGTGPVSFRTGDVQTALSIQTGIIPVPSQTIELRFVHVRAWNVSGPDIALRTFDLIGGNEPISNVSDIAAKNGYANAGYIWSDTQRNNVITGQTTPAFEVLPGVNTDIVRLYVHILYRIAAANLSRDDFSSQVKKNYSVTPFAFGSFADSEEDTFQLITDPAIQNLDWDTKSGDEDTDELSS